MTADRPGLGAVVDLLCLHRLAAGWSLQAVADRAGVKVDTVAAAERHRTRPRPETLTRIAAVYGPVLAGEVHRLSWCAACASAAVASFLVGSWPSSLDEENGGYVIHGRPPVVEIARRHHRAVVGLLAVAHDEELRR